MRVCSLWSISILKPIVQALLVKHELRLVKSKHTRLKRFIFRANNHYFRQFRYVGFLLWRPGEIVNSVTGLKERLLGQEALKYNLTMLIISSDYLSVLISKSNNSNIRARSTWLVGQSGSCFRGKFHSWFDQGSKKENTGSRVL